jgi:hypothetical protein
MVCLVEMLISVLMLVLVAVQVYDDSYDCGGVLAVQVYDDSYDCGGVLAVQVLAVQVCNIYRKVCCHKHIRQ